MHFFFLFTSFVAIVVGATGVVAMADGETTAGTDICGVCVVVVGI